jgi:beta-lactamase class A
MLKSKLPAILILCFLFSNGVYAQLSTLQPRFIELQKESGGLLGLSVIDFQTGDTVSLNAEKPFVMQSSFKFPIALAVLNQIETKKLSINQMVKVNKNQLPKETWSPMRDQLPEGTSEVSVKKLLSYMVSHSDNIACDCLLKIVGGPLVVEKFIHQKGVEAISIKLNEEEMGKNWEAQYQNWCHPKAMRDLLVMLYEGKMLSPENTKYLIKLMEETSTGNKRLKGLLPEKTVVAHRTGTSDRNKEGMSAAVVDVGMINLPDGKQIAIAVFVTGSKLDYPFIETVIAKTAKAVWDYETK